MRFRSRSLHRSRNPRRSSQLWLGSLLVQRPNRQHFWLRLRWNRLRRNLASQKLWISNRKSYLTKSSWLVIRRRLKISRLPWVSWTSIRKIRASLRRTWTSWNSKAPLFSRKCRRIQLKRSRKIGINLWISLAQLIQVWPWMSAIKLFKKWEKRGWLSVMVEWLQEITLRKHKKWLPPAVNSQDRQGTITHGKGPRVGPSRWRQDLDKAAAPMTI